jgi:hypothetical protein
MCICDIYYIAALSDSFLRAGRTYFQIRPFRQDERIFLKKYPWIRLRVQIM